ncbi:hypothetical protein J3E06_000271 [Methanococcus voltae]|uniref:Uncharacterized protein n=1 Tax=Methanococcus voltae (strain ATCC BAA-1334 / A3) TaxID=456320 RepID=D7DUI9_METV3|nr:hypothetical protein [Methanococcus voltae]
MFLMKNNDKSLSFTIINNDKLCKSIFNLNYILVDIIADIGVNGEYLGILYV